MDTTTLRDNFITLFRGRGDAYGHEEGRCVKQPLSLDVFTRHLQGTEPIGVYPTVPHGKDFICAWGCSDIDIEDISLAVTLKEALESAGVACWIERSRSKGYHVWVFAEKPVHAKDMRRMFLAAHQVADIPPREVNPKQEFLSGANYGNYVRLPYVGAFVNDTPEKRVILDDNLQPVQFATFIESAMATRVSAELIVRLASFYKEPEPQHTVLNLDTPTSVREALVGLSPLGKVIWRDGPLPSKDRSTTLAHLAHECVRSGLTPSETRVIIIDADKRWGKYHARANGEMEIDKLVVRVYK
jgi:hypothetical protein